MNVLNAFIGINLRKLNRGSWVVFSIVFCVFQNKFFRLSFHN